MPVGGGPCFIWTLRDSSPKPEKKPQDETQKYLREKKIVTSLTTDWVACLRLVVFSGNEDREEKKKKEVFSLSPASSIRAAGHS